MSKITSGGEITVEGKIVEVRNGEKKMSRSYTYGYLSLRVLVGNEYFSVLLNSSKVNKYGFLPRTGQWIRVKGRLFPSEDGFYDQSIKWVSELTHIDPPKRNNK